MIKACLVAEGSSLLVGRSWTDCSDEVSLFLGSHAGWASALREEPGALFAWAVADELTVALVCAPGSNVAEVRAALRTLLACIARVCPATRAGVLSERAKVLLCIDACFPLGQLVGALPADVALAARLHSADAEAQAQLDHDKEGEERRRRKERARGRPSASAAPPPVVHAAPVQQAPPTPQTQPVKVISLQRGR